MLRKLTRWWRRSADSDAGRSERFQADPATLQYRHGTSWVTNGEADPSVSAGQLYAFKDSASFMDLIGRAMPELYRVRLDDSTTAYEAFMNYLERVGKPGEQPGDFFRTMRAMLMLYTDDRFFRILNGAWRGNRSGEYLGISSLLVTAFEHAPYFIEGEVYRGVNLPDVSNYAEGLVFRWPFFFSASTERGVATQFGKTLFVIEVPADGNVRAIWSCSLLPDEREVLFHPYEVFEVLSAGPTEVRVRISRDIYFGMDEFEIGENREV